MILDRLDPVWRLAETVTRHHPWSLSGTLLPLVPLLVAGVPAYLKVPQGFSGLTARVWPLAALLVWFLTEAGLGATPLHAWTGITVPLGVLAVEGVQVIGFPHTRARRWIGVLALAALTIPGGYLQVKAAEGYIVPSTENQNLITPAEQRALSYLASEPQQGGVLSSYRLGDAVPGETGRHIYSGDYRWSGTAYTDRERLAWDLLHGRLSTAASRRFVLASGARFVLADCGATVDLHMTLPGLIPWVRRFGCATVYGLR